MEIVYVGVKSTERKACDKHASLKEGEVYQIAEDRVKEGDVSFYKVKTDSQKEELLPDDWFINLTELQEKYNAKIGVLDAPIFIGDRTYITLGWRPNGEVDDIIQVALTSPIEDAKEIAPDWYLFKTMTQHWYIGYVNPDLLFELWN